MRIDEVSVLVRETFGNNLRALRLESGLTQTAFAQMISVDRSYISQIECGKENVSVDVLVKLADGLDVPITQLFEGLEDAPPRKQTEKKHISYHGARLPR